MSEPTKAKGNQVPKSGVFKRFFRALYRDERDRYAITLLLWPYVCAVVVTWWDRGSLQEPKLEYLLVFVFFALGGRLWDLQHKADTAEMQMQGIAQRLAEIQRALDLDGALGERLLQIKGVSLDLTEQLSAVERKIDATKGVSLDLSEQLSAIERKIDASEGRAR